MTFSLRRLIRSSFRIKIAALAILTTVAALCFAYTTFIVHEWQSDRARLVEQRRVLAAVMAANASAPVVFEDRAAATETLASAAGIPGVTQAVLYDARGREFAAYRATARRNQRLEPGGSPGWTIDGRKLVVRTPVMVDRERVGVLVLVSTLDELHQMVAGYAVVAVIGVAGAGFLAVALSLWLAKLAIRPVRQLSEAMARVRDSGDFTVLVDRSSEDELGSLTDDFNALVGSLREHDQALRTARDDAEAANVAKSQFLANMSHEIRTPLNGVVGMAELLAGRGLRPEDLEVVDIIRASGQTLERLLSDILDLARVESGQVQLEYEPFHLGAAVRSVAALLQLQAEEKGVELRVSVAPDVDQEFRGDVVRVRQVVTNLVSNAVKFTDEGEVSVDVRRTSGGAIRIEVADTGVGFDPADKDKVFGRFQQADGSITRRFGGTGLGLAISRELVGLMGGELDCDSRPGAGSRFWFELPLEACASAARPAPAALGDSAGPSDAPTDRGLCILVADDHPTNRKVVELILGAPDVEIVAVVNGAEAVAAYQQRPFDLVLMDMQMPVMDGLTAIGAIRRLEADGGRRRTPVLMLTANALPEHIQASREAGADGHVTKPITARSLTDAVTAALRPAPDSEEGVAAA